MEHLEILDTTLRDGEQAPGNTMSAIKKLEVAKALSDLGVDIIEAGFPINRSDYEAFKLIAREIRSTRLSGFGRMKKHDIDVISDALKGHNHPVIHLFYPTSKGHLLTKFNQTEEDSLETIKDNILYARQFADAVIFTAEDATRSDVNHLLRACEVAYVSGTYCIDIADTVGYALPFQIGELVSRLREHLPDAKVGVHCHNDLGLATANALAGIGAGARHVQVTVNGLGERSGMSALEEVVVALNQWQDHYKVATNVDMRQIIHSSKLVYDAVHRFASHEKAIVGVNSFRHEAGIHVSAMEKDASTYESINPEILGINRKYVLGVHSSNNK